MVHQAKTVKGTTMKLLWTINIYTKQTLKLLLRIIHFQNMLIITTSLKCNDTKQILGNDLVTMLKLIRHVYCVPQ